MSGYDPGKMFEDVPRNSVEYRAWCKSHPITDVPVQPKVSGVQAADQLANGLMGLGCALMLLLTLPFIVIMLLALMS